MQSALSVNMYVRVKRHMTTWFVVCEPTETVADVKRKLQELTEKPEGEMQLVLVKTGQTLEENRTLAEQKVENDAVLGLVYRKENGSGWEELLIEKPEDHMGGLDSENL